MELISVNAEVLETAFTIALYVRELAHTARRTPFLPVPLSFLTSR